MVRCRVVFAVRSLVVTSEVLTAPLTLMLLVTMSCMALRWSVSSNGISRHGWGSIVTLVRDWKGFFEEWKLTCRVLCRSSVVWLLLRLAGEGGGNDVNLIPLILARTFVALLIFLFRGWIMRRRLADLGRIIYL